MKGFGSRNFTGKFMAVLNLTPARDEAEMEPSPERESRRNDQ